VKAVVYDRYGSPDELRVEEVPIPTCTAGQVLVRVAATSVNLSDWECLRGSPPYARLGGLRSPAHRTLGSDIAGWVEAVGEGVTRFRPGDEVYGDDLALMGGFAEYAVAPESALSPKPAELSFAEASTRPVPLRADDRAVRRRGRHHPHRSHIPTRRRTSSACSRRRRTRARQGRGHREPVRRLSNSAHSPDAVLTSGRPRTSP
jgi:NADPH:quinone reductase-like Zn-dependent oxidoreductase